MIATEAGQVPSILHSGAELRNAVFFDGSEARTKYSRFWMLLVLAAIIASAGVIGDSEATVIGAMIVAPLRIPILGTVLAIVLGDRNNLIRSAALVVSGGICAVAVGFLMASLALNSGTIVSSAQLATWSQARLIDLVAALAVGVVGAIALVRRDISDTLPGVAIAISLVPPLTVVGISLQTGQNAQAWGAMLLFATNVTAILAVGVVTMALYRVPRLGFGNTTDDKPIRRGQAYLFIGVNLVLILAILAQRSVSIAQDTEREATVARVVEDWSEDTDWTVVRVTSDDDVIVARLEGPLPVPDTADLGQSLITAGISSDDVEIDFVPRQTVVFDGAGYPCEGDCDDD